MSPRERTGSAFVAVNPSVNCHFLLMRYAEMLMQGYAIPTPPDIAVF